MQIRVVDNTGRPLKICELQSMGIWTPTMSHTCASALERAKQTKITISSAIEKKQDQ